MQISAPPQVDVTNSFAVPFEEDRDDPTIWFLDQTFLVEMARMFERINGLRPLMNMCRCLSRDTCFFYHSYPSKI